MMNIQKVSNRDEFIEYCLRKLGHPVIQINVDITQVQDRINDALKMFFDYHVDGAEKTYVLHNVTQDDCDNKFLEVPDNVLVITGVIQSNAATGGYNLNHNLQMKAYFSDLISFSTINGIGSYIMTKNYLNSFNNIMGGSYTLVSHNYYKRTLSTYLDWNKIKEGYIIGYEAWVANDIDEVYNDYWLQQYATALIKKQWGQNLIKVRGMTLPGGGQLNGEQILNEAKEEIADLEDRVKDEYAYPILPFMA